MPATRIDIPFDPLAAFEKARNLDGVSFLYSGMQAYGLGRFSILAAEPWKTLVVDDGNPFDRLDAELTANAQKSDKRFPYLCGPIGYVSYDAGRYLERISNLGLRDDEVSARFSFYRGAIVFDHETSEVFAVSGEGDPVVVNASLLDTVREPKFCDKRGAFSVTGNLRSNFSQSEFETAVGRIRDLIREGEVYQVNLSQRFEVSCQGGASELFLRLSEQNPAPYAAYLDFGDEQIVSSSPERFLTLKNGCIETRPIKGTRPVGVSEAETLRYEKELRESEKDRSELLMIVDLERNDLGRVAEPGTVEVDGLFELEQYATVIHQTATVKGKLEAGKDVVDCFRAMFPGGSITGAPKIRAMQVIEELERSKRGIYTGSIGYIDQSGGADFNIAIRTMRIADGVLSFQVGGGVVWDSDPKDEYEETLLKAKSMIRAIGGQDER